MLLTRNSLNELSVQALAGLNTQSVDNKKVVFTPVEVEKEAGLMRDFVLQAATTGALEYVYSPKNGSVEYCRAVATSFKHSTKDLMVIVREGTLDIQVSWYKSNEV